MFTSYEYEQWCKKLFLTDSAIEIINRVRESEPSCRVGGGRKNVVGAYPSKKMGVSIQFESHQVELPGLYLKEYDDSVIEMYDQPPSIKIRYKSLTEKVVTPFYTPDYFVIYDDRAGWEEWKTEEELGELARKSPNRYVKVHGKWRCPPAEEYAKQFGLHYWLKSSSEINWIFHRNIIFLEDYLLDTQTIIDSEIINTVFSYIRNNPGVFLIEVLENFKEEVDNIYYMIARKLIYVNLEQELLLSKSILVYL